MGIPVSVTIISLNEEAQIGRAIESARWADEILVIDSGSSDRTVEIAKSLGARVLHHAWQGYGQQKNFAQANAKHDWVLNIDADERVSRALADEIRETLEQNPPQKAFRLPRKTYYLGQWIRHGGWYPNRLTRLADRRVARWTEPPVHEELQVDGAVGDLKEPLDHDAFSSIRDQIVTNVRYSWLGSQELLKRGTNPCLWKLFTKPAWKFIETYLVKRGFMDGIAGLIISVNAAHSIFLKYAYLYEPKIRSRSLK